MTKEEAQMYLDDESSLTSYTLVTEGPLLIERDPQSFFYIVKDLQSGYYLIHWSKSKQSLHGKKTVESVYFISAEKMAFLKQVKS